jgi:SAM-dependent methyltransferase
MLAVEHFVKDDIELTKRKWDGRYAHINTISFDNITLKISINYIRRFTGNRKGLFLKIGCGTARNFYDNYARWNRNVGVDISLSH